MAGTTKKSAKKKKQEEMLYDLADLFKVFGDSAYCAAS